MRLAVVSDIHVEELERPPRRVRRYRAKTPQQGAAASVLLATSPLLEGIGGRYFDDCNEAVVFSRPGEAGLLTGVAPYALDADNAERLWEESVRLLA